MIQEKKIKFDTIYKTDVGVNNVEIKIQPEQLTPNTVQVNLNLEQDKANINNVSVDVGELCLSVKNDLRDISFHLNSYGELIVNAEDAENYSIDENGFLIYTYR